MNRRPILIVGGAIVSGMLLSGRRVIRLSTDLVMFRSGSCSFCRDTQDYFGLAGAFGRRVRVCHGCLDICLDILVEDVVEPFKSLVSEPERTLVGSREISSLEDLDQLITKLQSLNAEELPAVAQFAHGESSSKAKQCDFCDGRESKTRRVVVGPENYICDGCTFDAVRMFLNDGRVTFGAVS